jgi:hypothetical protein
MPLLMFLLLLLRLPSLMVPLLVLLPPIQRLWSSTSSAAKRRTWCFSSPAQRFTFQVIAVCRTAATTPFRCYSHEGPLAWARHDTPQTATARRARRPPVPRCPADKLVDCQPTRRRDATLGCSHSPARTHTVSSAASRSSSSWCRTTPL